MAPREFMNRIRMAFAEYVVETTEEQVRKRWRSFGLFWNRRPR